MRQPQETIQDEMSDSSEIALAWGGRWGQVVASFRVRALPTRKSHSRDAVVVTITDFRGCRYKAEGDYSEFVPDIDKVPELVRDEIASLIERPITISRVVFQNGTVEYIEPPVPI